MRAEKQMLFIMTLSRLLAIFLYNTSLTNSWSMAWINGQWGILKTGWTAELREVRSMTQSVAGGQPVVVYTSDQCGTQYCLISSLLDVAFINDVAECTISKSADDTNLGEVADAPEVSSAIQTGKISGWTVTSWGTTKGNANLCTRAGITPYITTQWRPTGWRIWWTPS